MINNAINSPAISNITTVNDAIVATNSSGVAAFRTTFAGSYTFTGANEFQGLNLFSGDTFFTNDCTFRSVESTYNTTTTISAADLASKTIVSTPGAGITLTLPTAANFNTELSSPPPNTAIENISITNLDSTNNIILAANTNFSLAGVPNTTISPLTTRYFKARKSTTTPAFILYG